MRLQGCMALFLITSAFWASLAVDTASAQYMYLDADADSINGASDMLRSLGITTTVDVWIITDQNRDASVASCSSGPDSLTINSYEVILHAVSGTVAYGNVTNYMAAYMPTEFGHAYDATDFYVGFGGGTYLPPGRYRLCSVEVTGVAGNPSIEVAPATPLYGAYLTSFGSRCAGVGDDNTLKLGGDWFDADGLQPGSGLALTLNVPPETTVAVGTAITVNATVEGGTSEGEPVLQALSVPAGASTSFSNDGRTASVHWVPLAADAGRHAIAFRATIGEDTAQCSATIMVPDGAANHPMYVSPSIRYYSQLGSNSGDPRIEVVDGQEQVGVFLETGASDEELAGRGITVGTRAGRHLTATCVRDSLPSILLSSDIDAVIEPSLVRLALDYSAVSAGVDGLRTHADGSQIQGLTGQGVVIGIVDSGIDVTHPDFKNLDGTSRILAYWDQLALCGGTCPGSPPAAPYNSSLGREWTPAPSESLYRQGGTYSRDFLGHGTWVAGIAAGNANWEAGNDLCSRRRYLGVAPRADIIAVKLAPYALLADYYPADKIVNAVDYIFRKAKGINKPAVVNLSLSSQFGPHDGRSYFDQFLDKIVADAGPGYIVVAAAGNDGANDIHGVADAHDATKGTILVDVPYGQPRGAGGLDSLELYAWFTREDEGAGIPGDSVTVTIISPNNGYSLGPITINAPPDSYGGHDMSNTPDGEITVDIGEIEPYYVSPPYGIVPPWGVHVLIRAPDVGPIKDGIWTLQFSPARAGSVHTPDGRVDAYITRRDIGDPVGYARMFSQPSSDEALGSPATADSVISVGAYVSSACWQDSIGEVVCKSLGPRVEDTYFYSSHGPRRDGVMKPDITAPGASIVAARSKDATFSGLQPPGDSLKVRVHGGGYVALDGTSAAAPHVSGVVALLLADSLTSTSWIRQKLQQTATRSDPYVSATPNKVWGWGKLNAKKAVKQSAFTLEVLAPVPGYSFPGYPFHAGVQESVTVRVTGTGTDANGVTLDLVQGSWCYSTETSLGTSPQLSPNQSYVFRFTLPTSLDEDSVRVRASASAGVLNGRSAWTRFQHRIVVGSPTGIGDGTEDSPPRFGVWHRSANPAGGAFVFRAMMPRAEDLSIQVFSIAGRLVWAQRSTVQTPGEVQFRWDGKDALGRRVGSGIYLLQATAGGERIVKKLVVMK